jgi:hypothetical protein
MPARTVKQLVNRNPAIVVADIGKKKNKQVFLYLGNSQMQKAIACSKTDSPKVKKPANTIVMRFERVSMLGGWVGAAFRASKSGKLTPMELSTDLKRSTSNTTYLLPGLGHSSGGYPCAVTVTRKKTGGWSAPFCRTGTCIKTCVLHKTWLTPTICNFYCLCE